MDPNSKKEHEGMQIYRELLERGREDAVYRKEAERLWVKHNMNTI